MRALVLIDFQKGFDNPVWGERNNPGAEDVALTLLADWRAKGWPIYHVQHLSAEGGVFRGEAAEFKSGFGSHGDEVLIQKSVNSAFIGTDLEARLRAAGTPQLTICGLTTPHCVSTTARMAANFGFDVELVEDATAAFTATADMSWKDGSKFDPQVIHDMALAHIHGEFVNVVRSKDILT